MRHKILQAIDETETLLAKAMSYSPEFRKPAQISYYEAHLRFLRAMLDGHSIPPAVADHASWDVMQCEIDARLATK